jgi:hypothetical protein
MHDKIADQRARAERMFKLREQQKADGPGATEDYYAAQQAIIDRTRKLRKQRLAREALINAGAGAPSNQ